MEKELKNRWLSFAAKLPTLFMGFVLCAAGLLMMRDAGLGMNPWGVFHVGLTMHTPLTFGQATQLVGLVILMMSVFLGIIPGLGSILNMFFVGFFVDAIDRLGIISTPNNFGGKLGLLLLGVLVLGWGTFFYLRAQLGAGPRDGLMEGLVKMLKRPVSMIRGSIEFMALIIGYILGGPVGIGTLITATTIGFVLQMAFRLGGYNTRESRHMDCMEFYQMVKATFYKSKTAANAEGD